MFHFIQPFQIFGMFRFVFDKLADIVQQLGDDVLHDTSVVCECTNAVTFSFAY